MTSDQPQKTNSLRLPARSIQLRDSKALMGAVALNITGGILAFMLFQYLGATEGERVMNRSRFVWEIILNLQILSAAMIWFCYSDRISGSQGQIQILQRFRLGFALLTVLVPTGFGALGIQQNWFVEQPSAATIQLFACVVFVYWLLGIWLHFLVQKRRQTSHSQATKKYRILFFLPAFTLLVITTIDAPGGGKIWLLAIPVLTYLQGSMPFISKAFGLR